MDKPDPIPAAYTLRELAIVKHTLLESYLEKLLLIIGSSQRLQKRIKFCYVDCFAGPWGDESEQLETTSIAISLRVLAACKVKLEGNGIATEIRAIYVEQNKIAYGRLTTFLAGSTPEGIEAIPLRGDFVQLRSEILLRAGSDTFCFFFIDPTGYTEVGVNILRPLLERPRSEFLINFMYDFANRVISRETESWQRQTRDLLGTNIDLQGLSPQAREQAALATYLTNLRSCMQIPKDSRYRGRSAYVRILHRVKERPHYLLVYLTSHPRGIVEFMKISEHVDLVQKQVRAVTKQAERETRSGTLDLFEANTWIDHASGHALSTDVDAYWLKYLALGEKQVSQYEFADILESTGWFESDLQASLVRLIAARKVTNLNANGRRRTRPLHFEIKSGERLALCAE